MFYIDANCSKQSTKDTCTISGDFDKGMYRSITICVIGSRMYDFLFVCLLFLVPLEHFSLNRRCHRLPWRAANFDLYSALLSIEKWRFRHIFCDMGHSSNMLVSGLDSRSAQNRYWNRYIAKRSAFGVSVGGPWKWPLYTDDMCNSRGGMSKTLTAKWP